MSLLSDRLNKKKTILGGGIVKKSGGSLASKFQKRSRSVLDKTYESRETRSKAGSMGKQIFEKEILEEFSITEFQPTSGDRFIEILPISFDPNVPYFRETSVHFTVGFSNDQFICPYRFLGQRCYRCEIQQKMFRVNNSVTDEIKRLYPSDRIIYLLWERTKELLEEEPPDYSLQLWNAPKTKVHAKIQNLTRDKIKRTTLDISDVSTDEGRTIGLTISRQGDFPDYSGFELHQRQGPIPEPILEQLEAIILKADEQGYQKCSLDMFFHFADYDEIKESMQTEEDGSEQETEEGSETTVKQRFPRQQKEEQGASQVTITKEDVERETLEYCENLQNELTEASSFTFNKWCKENKYSEAIGMDKSEAIEAIVEDIYTNMMAESDIPL
jgi:hypothetical protein